MFSSYTLLGMASSSELKTAVRKLNVDSYHTVKGLESYDPMTSPEATIRNRHSQLLPTDTGDVSFDALQYVFP